MDSEASSSRANPAAFSIAAADPTAAPDCDCVAAGLFAAAAVVSSVFLPEKLMEI